MALIFPRHMTRGRKWRVAAFQMQNRQELARAAGGWTQAKDLGPSLWRAEFETQNMLLADATQMMLDFETLRGSLYTLYAHTAEREWGGAYSAAELTAFVQAGVLNGITVAGVAAGADALSFSGLPAGYQFTAGDFIQVNVPLNPQIYQITEDRSADGNGDTIDIGVFPNVRPNVAAAQEVRVYQPAMEAVLEPGTLRKSETGDFFYTVAFSCIQVIR